MDESGFQTDGSDENLACVSCTQPSHLCLCLSASHEFVDENYPASHLSSGGQILSGDSWDNLEEQSESLESESSVASESHHKSEEYLMQLDVHYSQFQTAGDVVPWNPLIPIDHQTPAAIDSREYCDDNESSSSTVLIPQCQASLGSPDLGAFRQGTNYYYCTTSNGNVRIPSRDFIDGFHSLIWLCGELSAVRDLQDTVGLYLNRQFTQSTDRLCALFALHISLRSKYRNENFIQTPSFDTLREILYSDEYRRLASGQADEVGNDQVRQELLSENNLSVEAILNILRILGSHLNQNFALGICTPARIGTTHLTAVTEQSYNVYRRFDSTGNSPTTTVWIYNDGFDQDSSGLNHWSGFDVNPPLQRVISAPWFHFEVDGNGASSSNIEYDSNSAVFTPSSPAGSSYSITGSLHQDISRLTLVDQHDDSQSRMLSPPRPSLRRNGGSHSLGSSTAKELVQCEICRRIIQRKSLKKHLRTHDRTHAEKEKKHECPSCHKNFSYPKDLRRHQVTHDGSKPFKCLFLDCAYFHEGFGRDDHLHRHLAVVHSYPALTNATPSGCYYDQAPMG